MEVSGQIHAPATLISVKDPGTRGIEGWRGPRANVDAVGKTKKKYIPARSLVTEFPRLQQHKLSYTNHRVPRHVMF